MAEELLDGWLPLTGLERLEMEVRALHARYDQMRADLDETKAWVADIERARATRDEDNR